MSKIDASQADGIDLTDFMSCPACGAELDNGDLHVGGVGDWRKTILCLKCLHIRKNVPYEGVIVPLIAREYGLSVSQVREIEAHSQAEYEATLEDIQREIQSGI